MIYKYANRSKGWIFFYATGLEDCSGGCFEQFIWGEWQRLSDRMLRGIRKKVPVTEIGSRFESQGRRDERQLGDRWLNRAA